MDKKTIIASLMESANELDIQGLHKDADILTKIAQDFSIEGISDMLYGSPEDKQEIKKLENNWMEQNKTNQSEQKMEDLLNQTLKLISGINLRYTAQDGSVMLGAGLAHTIVENAQKLLNYRTGTE
jgi:DNA-binding transcriptional MerR regulator